MKLLFCRVHCHLLQAGWYSCSSKYKILLLLGWLSALWTLVFCPFLPKPPGLVSELSMATSFRCLIFAWRPPVCLWLTMTQHVLVDGIKVSVPRLVTYLHTVEPSATCARTWQTVIKQDDWALPGHLRTASSAVSRWPYSQDQQLMQGDFMTYR